MSRLERAADTARGAGKEPPPAGVSTVVRSIGTRRPQKALTTYAHMDPAHCLVHGLFSHREDGERPKLDLFKEYAGVHIHFAVREALDAYDLRVLSAIVALAGRDGTDETREAPSARLLWDGQVAAALPGDAVTRSIHVSRRALVREIGRAETGAAGDHILACIRRMADITLHCRTQYWEWSSRLLGYVRPRMRDEITIAINPRLAEAVGCGGQYAHLEMSALRDLSDIGVLLYHRLVGFVDRGGTRKVSLRTLAEYVWTDQAKTSNGQWKRPGKVRAAMREIDALPGWSVRIEEHNLFSISRR